MTDKMDRDALLCALTLAPATYSRNRFFTLYEVGDMRSVRRRASLVRSLVRHATRAGACCAVSPAEADRGFRTVTIDIPHLNFKRSTPLSPLELALFRYIRARVAGSPCDEDRSRIEQALLALSGFVPLGEDVTFSS
jgi:hypothetical protein